MHGNGSNGFGWLAGAAASLVLLAGAGALPAHCDSLEGPVAEDARLALERGDVAPVLKWVSEGREKELRSAFARAVKVRGLDGEAEELADLYFLETLVRLHRAGEGAPYTGLKPAGGIDPAVMAADAALEKGSVDALAGRVAGAVEGAIRARFAEALDAKKRAGESVAAGRAYVEAYVDYVHFVEGIHGLVREGGGHVHGAAD